MASSFHLLVDDGILQRNMPTYSGSCCCNTIQYAIELSDASKDARTSLCHCENCKKFTGGPFGITTKIPRSAFSLVQGDDAVRIHEADNGSGVLLRREFCGVCGSPIIEFGANAGGNIYVFHGTMNSEAKEAMPPKGEFFCKRREKWMPEIPGMLPLDFF